MDGDREPTEQGNTSDTSTATKVYNLLQPSNSVRTWQLILMVLTVFGSMFSSSNFSGTNMRLEVKPQLMAAIFAMGILHVGALEVSFYALFDVVCPITLVITTTVSHAGILAQHC